MPRVDARQLSLVLSHTERHNRRVEVEQLWADRQREQWQQQQLQLLDQRPLIPLPAYEDERREHDRQRALHRARSVHLRWDNPSAAASAHSVLDSDDETRDSATKKRKRGREHDERDSAFTSSRGSDSDDERHRSRKHTRASSSDSRLSISGSNAHREENGERPSQHNKKKHERKKERKRKTKRERR